jgi:hypothetical protein
MPKSNATKKRKPANTFSVPNYERIARRQAAQQQKEVNAEKLEETKDKQIMKLYTICTDGMKRLMAARPDKYAREHFPELNKHEFLNESPIDVYPYDDQDDQIHFWLDRIEKVTDLENELLNDSNPFIQTGKTSSKTTTDTNSSPPTTNNGTTANNNNSQQQQQGETLNETNNLSTPTLQHQQAAVQTQQQQQGTTTIKTPTLTAADQNTLKTLLQGGKFAVHSPPHNVDGQLTDELQNKFTVQLHSLIRSHRLHHSDYTENDVIW